MQANLRSREEQLLELESRTQSVSSFEGLIAYFTLFADTPQVRYIPSITDHSFSAEER